MEHRAIHVLLIEDNPGDARLLQELLREVTSVQIELEPVDCLSKGLQRHNEASFDVILLDLSLPDSQGFHTFERLHTHAREIPIIVTTGLNDETLALRAVQEGAQDYLVKGQITGELLVRSIRYAIERKRAEQKIREQAALLDIATDAILVRDLENRILFWNKGAERLYGWKGEEALGQKTDELLYKEISSQFQEAQKILIAKGEWRGELNQVTKTGREIIVESRWTLVHNAGQQPKFILVVSTDVTEKKQLETQFFRAQRMESIGTLASGIAHDLNNILTPVLATAQLLQIKLTNIDERSHQMLQAMEANAKRGAELVKQVLSFARGLEGKHTILQIKHLILEIQQIVQETFPKSIEVYMEVPEDLWAVTGNATQLHQVLMNLCVNARDAMPAGGHLKILTENLTVDENYARMNLDAREGTYIGITIADTGTGIFPEILDKIFEPFFTTKELGKGTGLGLSTVLGIIKSHHGFITVTSSVGQGTEFKVFLPAVIARDYWEANISEALMGHEELILVVDDEAAIREVSRASLEAYNYQVLTANDGIEAISLYVQHRDEIGLVLVDMMMPSMDGPTTIRTLQKINPQIKIIAVSGLLSGYQVVEESYSGVQAFLPKPYPVKELVKTIHEVLEAEPPILSD
ncbi:response regulator [Leptolyngbya sp. FACHB-261]|uniref:hybrid sensor histidine kinase/response regulator n=1 Tax=Leptolyngbya sp. FACHB-261 TaxID=2692806 RepID=UPI001681EFDF|nr:response regulator [Leptolyngbya sp. FACHB-261]MBD2102479.1 response regulator [Leptolyngbya sp. FACHB-261]